MTRMMTTTWVRETATTFDVTNRSRNRSSPEPVRWIENVVVSGSLSATPMPVTKPDRVFLEPVSASDSTGYSQEMRRARVALTAARSSGVRVS